jgi:hypothetical protein
MRGSVRGRPGNWPSYRDANFAKFEYSNPLWL